MSEVKLKVAIGRKFDDITMWFTKNWDKEIAGYILGRIKNGIIFVEDIIFPEQEVGCASVDMDGKVLIKLRKEYGSKCNRILGEWHSHCKMGKSWSTTDEEEMINPWADVRDVSVFIVSNDDGHNVRVELRKPFWVSIDELDYCVVGDNKIGDFCEEVIKDKIKKEEEKDLEITTNINEDWGSWNKGDREEWLEKEQRSATASRYYNTGRIIQDMVKFFHKKDLLLITQLCEEEADYLQEELKVYDPTVVIDSKNTSVFNQYIKMKIDKDELKDAMKDIRGELKRIIK